MESEGGDYQQKTQMLKFLRFVKFAKIIRLVRALKLKIIIRKIEGSSKNNN